MTLQLLSGVLLVCLGLLLRTSWTIPVLPSKLRRLSKEGRRLDEQWSAVRTDGCIALTVVENSRMTTECLSVNRNRVPGEAGLSGLLAVITESLTPFN